MAAVQPLVRVNPALTVKQCAKIFDEADVDGSGNVGFEEFLSICELGALDTLKMLGTSNRDASGVLKVTASQVGPGRNCSTCQRMEFDSRIGGLECV